MQNMCRTRHKKVIEKKNSKTVIVNIYITFISGVYHPRQAANATNGFELSKLTAFIVKLYQMLYTSLASNYVAVVSVMFVVLVIFILPQSGTPQHKELKAMKKVLNRMTVPFLRNSFDIITCHNHYTSN